MTDQVPSREIKNLSEFLEKCLNRKIVNYTIEALTKAGENYGGELQSIRVQVDGGETFPADLPSDSVNIVCKTPATDPAYAEVFQPFKTFVKENRFYSDVIPAIRDFEEISNVPLAERIDAFVHCYGSRISLDPNAELADIDAVLLLENIKAANYSIGNRIEGLNDEESLGVLKRLAQLHALSIAIRRLKPDIFDSKIRPFLTPINLNIDDPERKMLQSIHNELYLLEEIDPKLRAEIQKHLKDSDEFIRNTNPATDSPYTTIVHRDLWVNNIMMKRDDCSTVNIKIVDFQLCIYESFVHDLIFFLFTSVNPDDLEEHFTCFINYYHTSFIRTLAIVKCPLDDYSFEKMWREIQRRAKIELLHVLFMIKMITFDASASQERDPDAFYDWKELPDNVSKRWQLLIDIFSKNGFI